MAYNGPFKGTFKQGDKGLDCAAVKRTLKRLQENDAIVYGHLFGKPASDALKRFQRHHHLTADGVFGRGTFNALSPLMIGYEVLLYKKAPARQNVIANWAVLAPNADRAGVHTKQEVINFVAKTAHIYGHPLVITTGTNHNQYVLGTNRQSAHWLGEAADVAMFGTNLTRLGRCALQAAGMPRAQALQCRGGVYNVGGWNILFNTSIGGNHYNHCHMGTT